MKFGRRGDDGSDFVTAPELSPLFAATLARPVAQALRRSGTRDLMEFGAGTGKLAAGLLNALRDAGRPVRQLFDRGFVGRIARAPARDDRSRCARTRVEGEMARCAARADFAGVVIGNEVLDAMPVRLVVRKLGAWHERGVRGRTSASPSTTTRLRLDDPLVATIDAAIDDSRTTSRSSNT